MIRQQDRQRLMALADEGRYIAANQASTACCARITGSAIAVARLPPTAAPKPPTTQQVTRPRQVCCWDMTHLPTAVPGQWFLLHLILDIHSREIVGFTVDATDHSDHAADLLRRSALAEGTDALADKPVLDGDSGATLRVTPGTAPRWPGSRHSRCAPTALPRGARRQSCSLERTLSQLDRRRLCHPQPRPESSQPGCLHLHQENADGRMRSRGKWLDIVRGLQGGRLERRCGDPSPAVRSRLCWCALRRFAERDFRPKGFAKRLPGRTSVAFESHTSTFLHRLEHDAGKTEEINPGHELVVDRAGSGKSDLGSGLVQRFPCQSTHLDVIRPVDAENDSLPLNF